MPKNANVICEGSLIERMFPLEEIGVFSDWNSDRTVEKFIFVSRLDVDRPLQNSCHKKKMIAEFLLEKKQTSPEWKISVKNLIY